MPRECSWNSSTEGEVKNSFREHEHLAGPESVRAEQGSGPLALRIAASSRTNWLAGGCHVRSAVRRPWKATERPLSKTRLRANLPYAAKAKQLQLFTACDTRLRPHKQGHRGWWWLPTATETRCQS